MVRLPPRDDYETPRIIDRPVDSFAARISDSSRSLPTRLPIPQPSFVADPNRPVQTSDADAISWMEIAGESITDQAKTFLAILGCCAVLLQTLRILGGSDK